MPPVTSTSSGSLARSGKNRAARALYTGRSPDALSTAVGAVQPTAVTSRSHNILVPSGPPPHGAPATRPRRPGGAPGARPRGARRRPARAGVEARDPVAVVTAEPPRGGQPPDPGLRRPLRRQLPQRREAGLAAPAQVTAELMVLLDEHDTGPGPGRGDRCCHPGAPAAGDQDVGGGVPLLPPARRWIRRN